MSKKKKKKRKVNTNRPKSHVKKPTVSKDPPIPLWFIFTLLSLPVFLGIQCTLIWHPELKEILLEILTDFGLY